MNHIQNTLGLLGRILLAAFFIPGGIGKITAYAGTVAYMTSHGVPGWLLPLVILTELGGGLLLLVGWHTRIVAFLLGGFSILAVLIFWMNPTGQIEHLLRGAELAVAGGLWVLAARGASGWSVDALLARRKDGTAAAKA